MRIFSNIARLFDRKGGGEPADPNGGGHNAQLGAGDGMFGQEHRARQKSRRSGSPPESGAWRWVCRTAWMVTIFSGSLTGLYYGGQIVEDGGVCQNALVRKVTLVDELCHPSDHSKSETQLVSGK